MAINKAGGFNPGKMANIAHQNAVLKDMKTIDAKEAANAAQTGASNVVAKKNKANETKKPTSGITLSEAAQKALDKAEAKDTAKDALKSDIQEAKTANIDDAAQSIKRRDEREDEVDSRKVGPEGLRTKDGSMLLPMDESEDGQEVYKISKKDADNLQKTDGQSYEQIINREPAMPESSEVPARNMVEAQGPVKLAKELKDNPEVTKIAEKLDLDPAESLKEGARLWPISRNDEPLKSEVKISPNDEKLAKEAAIKQMQSGNQTEIVSGYDREAAEMHNYYGTGNPTAVATATTETQPKGKEHPEAADYHYHYGTGGNTGSSL